MGDLISTIFPNFQSFNFHYYSMGAWLHGRTDAWGMGYWNIRCGRLGIEVLWELQVCMIEWMHDLRTSMHPYIHAAMPHQSYKYPSSHYPNTSLTHNPIIPPCRYPGNAVGKCLARNFLLSTIGRNSAALILNDDLLYPYTFDKIRT